MAVLKKLSFKYAVTQRNTELDYRGGAQVKNLLTLKNKYLMETKTKDTDARILVRIADRLTQAQQELDELVLQFSLGKADAKDKFEEIKSEFKDQISEFKNSTISQKVDGVTHELRERLDELVEILKKGATHSAEAFEIQKKQIEHALDQLKKHATKHQSNVPDHEYFSHEIEKFKLKLEIIHLAFTLKKLEVKDSFKEKMQEIKKGIDLTISSAKEKMKSKKGKVNEFRKEAREVYIHMKKAIEAL